MPWYVSTCPTEDGLNAVLHAASADASLTSLDVPRDIELVERAGAKGRYLFAINHTDGNATITLTQPGTDLITGENVSGSLELPAGAARVVCTPW